MRRHNPLVELMKGFLAAFRSLELGEYSWRYTGVCRGAYEMGIFEVHCAVLIHGVEWHAHRASTSL